MRFSAPNNYLKICNIFNTKFYANKYCNVQHQILQIFTSVPNEFGDENVVNFQIIIDCKCVELPSVTSWIEDNCRDDEEEEDDDDDDDEDEEENIMVNKAEQVDDNDNIEYIEQHD